MNIGVNGSSVSLNLVYRVPQIIAADSEYSSYSSFPEVDAMVIYTFCVSNDCKQFIELFLCSRWWYLSC